MHLFKLKFLGPTNHQGQRIKVTSNQKSRIIPWDYSLDQDENYKQAGYILLDSVNPDYLLSNTTARLFYIKSEMFVLMTNSEET